MGYIDEMIVTRGVKEGEIRVWKSVRSTRSKKIL